MGFIAVGLPNVQLKLRGTFRCFGEGSLTGPLVLPGMGGAVSDGGPEMLVSEGNIRVSGFSSLLQWFQTPVLFLKKGMQVLPFSSSLKNGLSVISTKASINVGFEHRSLTRMQLNAYKAKW